MRFLILVGLTTLVVAQAHAQAEVDHDSANYIFPHCSVDEPPADGDRYLSGLCGGIIKTIADLSGVVCASGATLDQETRVVIKYVSARPKMVMDLPFATLATLALTDAWPCKADDAHGERERPTRGRRRR
jgi:hypothetical protein